MTTRQDLINEIIEFISNKRESIKIESDEESTPFPLAVLNSMLVKAMKMKYLLNQNLMLL